MGALVDRLKADPTLGFIHLSNNVAFRGALLIKLGDETMGAAGAPAARKTKPTSRPASTRRWIC
jgi:hypothetical protein